MPPDRHSSQDAFDIDLLDSQALDAPDGLAIALHTIEAVCHRGDPEIAEMVATLNSRPYILEYIISGTLRAPIGCCPLLALIVLFLVLEEGAYEKLSKWTVTGLPTSKTPNMMDAMSMRLLERFSSSLLFAEYPSPADASPNLREFCRKVELSFDVLNALEENADNALTGGNVPSVSRKKGKVVAINCPVDSVPFNSMRITVPTTDAEVRGVCVGILSQLRNILEVCVLIADSLCVELNSLSTISSFLGSRCYQRFSNPRTRRQNCHRKEPLPRQQKK